MGNKKISIIIPVYKVECYLEECMESLLKQSYHNLEIILIDDESPDKCPQICDFYMEKDDRVKVIHKKNGGAASARNSGLDIATGDYICFVDSDDFVDSNYIKELLFLLEKNEVDIAVCSFSNVYINQNEIVEMESPGLYSSEEFLERFLWDWKCGLIWNKIFKSELMKNIRFAEGHVIDDEFFTYKIVLNAKRIYVDNIKLYNYRQRISGVMNQGKKVRMLEDRLEYLTERFQVVSKEYSELYEKYLENLADNLISLRRSSLKDEKVYLKIKKAQIKYLTSILFGKINIKLKYAYIKAFFYKGKIQGLKNDKEDKEYFQ